MAACAATLVSCSDDDEPATPSPQTFVGELESRIPMFPDFSTLDDDNATITWTDATATTCTIDLGGFDVHVDRPELPAPMDIEIGDMKITGVKCAKEADGSYKLEAASFDCMAGKYEIKGGSLSGTLKSGTLVLTLNYKPGSMPFPVVSTFTGTSK